MQKKRRIAENLARNFVLRSGVKRLILPVLLLCVLAFSACGALLFLSQNHDRLLILVGFFGVFVLFSSMIAVLFWRIDRFRTIKEVENALFTQIAQAKSRFFLLLNDQLEVLYYSPTCDDYFSYQPYMSNEGFENVMDVLGIDSLAWKRLFDPESLSRSLVIEVENKEGVRLSLMLHAEQLTHPAGYWHLYAAETQTQQPTMRTQQNAKGAAQEVDGFLQSLPIPGCVIDNSGFMVMTNDACTQLCAESISAGWQFSTLACDADKTGLEASWRAALRTHSEAPHRFVLKTDTTKLVTVYYQPLMVDNKPMVVAYLLESVDKQTLDDKAIQAQKMQAVGQLAGGVAHDFNNLLTAMTGFCDLLLARHTPGDPSFNDIMQIKQNANRASNLVRQLLAFSRKQTLQPEVIEISETMSDLSSLMQRLLGSSVDLDVSYGRHLHPICVDEGQLEQVIINLAVNARDAMPDGGQLSISVQNTTIGPSQPFDAMYNGTNRDLSDIQHGDYLMLQVQDTGKGMPKPVMQQVFEPFFTTKDVGEGTGLGLSTVYGIVDQTGGHIFVNSQEGHGTVFTLLFPKYNGEATGVDMAPIETTSPVKTTPKVASPLGLEEAPAVPYMPDLTGNATILLVEDEIPVRIFTSRALSNKGYTVLEAASGEEGLEVAAEHRDSIELIVSDVMMPGITGPSMVEQLLPDMPHVEVIFASGYGEDAFTETLGDSRSFHFLPKPFDMEKLLIKVKAVLDEANSKKAA